MPSSETLRELDRSLTFEIWRDGRGTRGMSIRKGNPFINFTNPEDLEKFISELQDAMEAAMGLEEKVGDTFHQVVGHSWA